MALWWGWCCRETAARGRYQSVRVHVQSVRASGSCRVFSVHFFLRRHPRHTIRRFVHLYASFVYGSLCTIFEFPVEILRCDVEKCQRRLWWFRTIDIDLWNTDRESRGRFDSTAGASLVEKHVDRLFEIIDNYFFSNISHSRDIL